MHIEALDKNGNIAVRDATIAAFFCRQPYPLLAKQFNLAFDRWLSQSPEDAKRWAIVGPNGDEYKPVTPRSLARARAEFDPQRAKIREMCSLDIIGPQEINADWGFSFGGSRDVDGEDTCYVEVRTPTDLTEADPNRYVDFVHGIAELLTYDSGQASPALVCGVDSQKIAFAQLARQWSFRHPGFDLPYNSATCFGIGGRLRGSFWLTFIGPEVLSKLGGEVALRKALPAQVELRQAGVGVMLRLSHSPEVGDINRLDDLPIVRATAKVLESVTLIGDKLLNNNFIDHDERARWERRHLD